MRALTLASFLLAGAFYDHQMTWSPPQTVFGGPHSSTKVPLDNWAATVRMGELAWSLSDGKFATAAAFDRFPALNNVLAERSQ